MIFEVADDSIQKVKSKFTKSSISTLAYICLQSYWSSLIFVWGCGDIVLRFLLKISKVENL